VTQKNRNSKKRTNYRNSIKIEQTLFRTNCERSPCFLALQPSVVSWRENLCEANKQKAIRPLSEQGDQISS
jgi:hypothetical protein